MAVARRADGRRDDGRGGRAGRLPRRLPRPVRDRPAALLRLALQGQPHLPGGVARRPIWRSTSSPRTTSTLAEHFGTLQRRGRGQVRRDRLPGRASTTSRSSTACPHRMVARAGGAPRRGRRPRLPVRRGPRRAERRVGSHPLRLSQVEPPGAGPRQRRARRPADGLTQRAALISSYAALVERHQPGLLDLGRSRRTASRPRRPRRPPSASRRSRPRPAGRRRARTELVGDRERVAVAGREQRTVPLPRL